MPDRLSLTPPPVEVYAKRRGTGWVATWAGTTIWAGAESMEHRLTWIGCPQNRRVHMEGKVER